MPTNKTPNLTMNLSPITVLNRNSPKEKRTFTFFRSRTLSSSSTESNGGGGGGGGGSGGNSYNSTGLGPPSPRLSPRTLFDKVRKRSQSDVKSQPSVDQIGLNTFQHNLQMHLQQQLQEKLLLQQQEQFQQHLLLKKQMLNANAQQSLPASSNAIISVSINGGRKHLNHSISEEGDESIINEEQDSPKNQSQNPLDALFALSSPNKLKVSVRTLDDTFLIFF
jgi:hypothetical protein